MIKFHAYSTSIVKINARYQGLKTPFLCPDGRVAAGEGRLAQWGRTKLVLPHWAQSLSSLTEQVVRQSLQPNRHSFSLL